MNPADARDYLRHSPPIAHDVTPVTQVSFVMK
jgi:hypothetical protein